MTHRRVFLLASTGAAVILTAAWSIIDPESFGLWEGMALFVCGVFGLFLMAELWGDEEG